MRRSAALDGRAILLLALVVAVFFGPALTFRGVYAYADFTLYTARFVHTAYWLRSGHFPLWNPWLSLGGPHAAVSGSFYPPQVLLCFLLGVSAYGYLLALHALLAATGTFAFGRTLELTRAAAALAGIAYSLGGFAFGHLQHLDIVVAMAWLPLVLATVERFLVTSSRRFLGLAMLSVGLLNLGGHPQIVLYGLTATAAYAVFRLGALGRAGESHRLPGLAAGLAATLVVGVALAGVFVLPFAEWMRFVARGNRITEEYAVWYSLPKPWLSGLLAPFWMGGSPGRPEGAARLVEWSSYVGLLPIALAPVALARPRGRVLFFWGLALVAVLLSLGGHTPFYRLVLALPVFASARAPARFMVLASLALAILAGFGLDTLRLGSARWLARLSGLALLLVAGAVGVAGWRGARFAWILPRRSDPVSFSREDTVVLFVALASAAVLLFVLAHRAPLGPARLGLVLAFTAADLYAFQSQLFFNGLSPRAVLEEPGANAVAMRDDGGPPRFFTETGKELESLVFDAPDFDRYRLLLRETLRNGLNMCFRLQSLTGYKSEPEVHERLISVIRKRRQFDSRSARLAGVYGVRYVIGSEVRPVSAPELTLLRHGARDLFRNEAAVPRAYLVGESRLAQNDLAAFAMVKHPSFDPRRTVVLEEGGGPPIPETPLGTAEAAILYDSPDRVVVETKAERAAWLVLNDTYGPGWEARIDGHPAKVLRANGLVRAVAVAAGNHRVEFAYRPAAVAWGAALSLLALSVAAWLVFGRRPARGDAEGRPQRPSISA